jgi:hypothetical protein
VAVVVCVGIAALGAATSPAWVTLGLAPAAGLFVAGVVNPVLPSSPGARRAAVYAAAAAAVCVPLVNGLVLFGAFGAAWVLALLVLGAARVGAWVADVGDTHGAAAVLDGTAEALQELVTMPVEGLVELWRATETVLRSPPDAATLVRTAQLRAALLDEMAVRDPDGVGRWLAAGGPEPGRHLRTDHDAAG